MQNSISVVGHGEGSVAPDAAFFDVGVNVVQPTVGAASARAATRAQAVIDALHAEGVAPEDIGTRDYSVYPEYDQRGNHAHPRVRGYRVQNTVQVTVRRIDDVSEIIDRCTAAGGDSITVQNLRFGASDPSAAEAEARAAAWRSARSRAQQLARLAGVSLGPVVSMDETGHRSAGPAPRMMRAEMAAASAPPIEPGMSSVTVTIHVVFGIAS